MLNIMSSYGWYEKSLRRSHNYQPIMRAFDDTMKAFNISRFLTAAWVDEKKYVSKKSMYSLNSCLLYIYNTNN